MTNQERPQTASNARPPSTPPMMPPTLVVDFVGELAIWLLVVDEGIVFASGGFGAVVEREGLVVMVSVDDVEEPVELPKDDCGDIEVMDEDDEDDEVKLGVLVDGVGTTVVADTIVILTVAAGAAAVVDAAAAALVAAVGFARRT